MGFDVLARQHRGNLPALGASIVSLAHEIDALGTTGYAALPLGEFAPLQRQPVMPRFFEQVRRPMDRDFLDAVTIAGKHDRVQVPSFNVGGWYDIFLGDTLANFSAMRQLGQPTKLLIGPWSHMERSRAGRRSELRLRFTNGLHQPAVGLWPADSCAGSTTG